MTTDDENLNDLRAKLRAMRKPVPRYDPARDGNPFQWIVENGAKLRKELDEAARKLPHNIDYLTGKIKP